MPRSPRIDIAGAIHHVHARGNNRQAIFGDEGDRHAYLALLEGIVLRYGWNCLTYCLMTNHVHLLIETPEPNLADGMRDLHGKYARYFNERHGAVGHLFQRRYGSELITDERYLATVVAYIALNPVAAGLCKRPEAWPWSSHRATLVKRRIRWLATERLLALLGAGKPAHVEHYLELVEARLELID